MHVRVLLPGFKSFKLVTERRVLTLKPVEYSESHQLCRVVMVLNLVVVSIIGSMGQSQGEGKGGMLPLFKRRSVTLHYHNL